MPLHGSTSVLIAATDTSEIYREQSALEGQIRELEDLRQELDEAGRNIHAYLETLPGPEEVRRRKKLIETTHGMADHVFHQVEKNLVAARQDPGDAGRVLRENLDLTRDGIAVIRSAVARLRGE